MSKPTHCPTCKGPLDNVGYCARCFTVWFISAHDTRGAGGMMADLTPDELAALQAAINDSYGYAMHKPPDEFQVAIWRAARAYQAEQDAQPLDDAAACLDGGRWVNQVDRHVAEVLRGLAAAIRDRAKGLT